MSDPHPGFVCRRPRSWLLSVGLAGAVWLGGVLPPTAWLAAAPPAWWHGSVIDETRVPDDYAAINLGQLKNLAKAAAAKLDADLPGGAGNEIHALLAGWQTPNPARNDFTLVNLGQLKEVARPFYDQLIRAGYANRYPWLGAAGAPNDFAAANIGQAKELFSFDWTNLFVRLASPLDGASYPNSSDVYVSAVASGLGYAVVSKVEFYADAAKIGESTGEPYGVNWTRPPTGSHLLTAVATDGNGAATVSHPARITVADGSPAVTLVSAQPAYKETSGKLLARVLGATAASLTSLKLNGQTVPPKTGEFDLDVTLTPGNNTFTLVATDNQNRSGQAAITVLCAPTGPTVTISEPAANASVSAARINVKGTISGPTPLASLSVNGLKAVIDGTNYTVLNVPIAAGANTLTAQAVDVAGNVSTAAVNVTGVATGPNGNMADALKLQASPQSGFGPLLVTLTPTFAVPGTIQEISYDFGDNIIGITSSQAPMTHQYQSPGEYYPVITVKTSAGSFSSDGGVNASDFAPRLTIHVFPQPQLQTFAQITNPVDLAAAADGSLYVLSGSTATVTEFNRAGQMIRTLANVGSAPTGLDIDKSGNVYVALSGSNQVVRLKPTSGSFAVDTSFNATGLIGNADGSAGTTAGAFAAPYDVAVSPDGGSIYVSDTNNNRIEKLTKDGQFSLVVDAAANGVGPLNHPKGLSAGDGDAVFVADAGNNRVVRIDADSVTSAQGTSGTNDGQFASPRNVACEGDGIYVADTGNNRIQNFGTERSGHETIQPTFALHWLVDASAGLNQPGAVACGFDPLGTTLYIADTGNNRVVSSKVARSDTPDAVWQQMQARMAALDIEGAVACFTESMQQPHRDLFRSLGAQQSAEIVAGAGPIAPIFIGKDEAEYTIDKNIVGQVISFPVWFARENGRWKIQEF